MMLQKGLKYVAVLACAVLALAGALAADDKKNDKDKPTLTGVWTQKGGEVKLDFSTKEVLKVYPHGDKDVIVVVCKYTLEKDGLVKATITGFEGKDEIKQKAKAQLPEGLEFNFKWRAKDDNATLEDVGGDKAPAILKSHLEGKYEQKK